MYTILQVLAIAYVGVGLGFFVGYFYANKENDKYYIARLNELQREYDEACKYWHIASNKVHVYQFMEWRKKDGIILTFYEAKEYLESISK